ncbi:MAG: hypothetical protein J6039_05000 [Alphaproteobacteria bacterium]|nr:hypothetical protein [Alphaproteobacteria bacterium]
MLASTKKTLKKWFYRIAIFVILCGVVRANVNRFKNNTFSNYEKAIDYGRVREVKEKIEPIIAAIFYKEEHREKNMISSYLDHSDNYRRENVKIIVIPPELTPESRELVENLYQELAKHNHISKIYFVSGKSANVSEHRKILQKNLAKDIKFKEIAADSLEDAFLEEKGAVIVFSVDFKRGNTDDKDIENLINLARRKKYSMQVFDIIDTEMSKAFEKDYTELFESNIHYKSSELDRQKNNLADYKKNYEAALITYFKRNLNLRGSENPIWPEKDQFNYRLYDRGNVYVRLFGENNQEIFSRAKIGKNKGIVVSLIEVARKAAIKLKKKVKRIKIYLLTDMEPLENKTMSDLADCLDKDDGLYIQYKNKKVLAVAEELGDNAENLAGIIKKRLNILYPEKGEEFKLYKFKTEEIEDEN